MNMHMSVEENLLVWEGLSQSWYVCIQIDYPSI